jgi:hypothetical protein
VTGRSEPWPIRSQRRQPPAKTGGSRASSPSSATGARTPAPTMPAPRA